jgi:hypothetical protein
VASTKRYPYFTVLFRQTEENGTDYLRFACGGSLIRDDVVITAATSTSHLQSNFRRNCNTGFHIIVEPVSNIFVSLSVSGKPTVSPQI